MHQFLRLLLLVAFEATLFVLPALGWLKLLEVSSALFPPLQEIANSGFIKSFSPIVGLAFALLPFYIILYFNSSKKKEILGFKPPLSIPNSDTAEQGAAANPYPLRS